MWYEVAAKTKGVGLDEAVALCFDPTIVIRRLLREFEGEVTVCIHDYGWNDYNSFIEIGASPGALRVAQSDAWRRSPIFIFRFRTGTEQEIRGKAERHAISIGSHDPIAEPLKSRFLKFLEGLRCDPMQVSAVQIDGNKVTEL